MLYEKNPYKTSSPKSRHSDIYLKDMHFLQVSLAFTQSVFIPHVRKLVKSEEQCKDLQWNQYNHTFKENVTFVRTTLSFIKACFNFSFLYS